MYLCTCVTCVAELGRGDEQLIGCPCAPKLGNVKSTVNADFLNFGLNRPTTNLAPLPPPTTCFADALYDGVRASDKVPTTS